MTRKTLELMKGLDAGAVETQIVLHCAPFLEGLKVSNLLLLPGYQAESACKLLQEIEICHVQLYQGEKKAAILLYHRQGLFRHLSQPQAAGMLDRMGYAKKSLETQFRILSARYTSFMQGSGMFPHEMGLFLGYPPEDVQGFITHHGKGFLYAGYWKVYQDKAGKVQLFRKFDQAQEALICLLARLLYSTPQKFAVIKQT